MLRNLFWIFVSNLEENRNLKEDGFICDSAGELALKECSCWFLQSKGGMGFDLMTFLCKQPKNCRKIGMGACDFY